MHVTWVIPHPSGTHYSPVVRGQHIIFFGACVYNILRHGTLEILQLCHLGICMCTMETHTGLIGKPYTLHIEEVRSSEGIPPGFQDCMLRTYEKTPRSAAGMLHPPSQGLRSPDWESCLMFCFVYGRYLYIRPFVFVAD